MARLDHLWVIHTTAKMHGAGTDDAFTLGLLHTHGNPLFETWIKFPNLPHDERECGRTDQYFFDDIPKKELMMDMVLWGADNFAIRTAGSDAWLPDSIFVIGQDVEGTQRLLAGVPNWPNNLWFSQDLSEGKAKHRLDELFRP